MQLIESKKRSTIKRKVYNIVIIGPSRQAGHLEQLSQQLGKSLAKTQSQIYIIGTSGSPYAVAESAHRSGSKVVGWLNQQEASDTEKSTELRIFTHINIVEYGYEAALAEMIDQADAVVVIAGKRDKLKDLTIKIPETKISAIALPLLDSTNELKSTSDQLSDLGQIFVSTNPTAIAQNLSTRMRQRQLALHQLPQK